MPPPLPPGRLPRGYPSGQCEVPAAHWCRPPPAAAAVCEHGALAAGVHLRHALRVTAACRAKRPALAAVAGKLPLLMEPRTRPAREAARPRSPCATRMRHSIARYVASNKLAATHHRLQQRIAAQPPQGRRVGRLRLAGTFSRTLQSSRYLR